MFGKTFVAALFASLAAAQVHAPVGAQPEGNPITRPLNEVVPAGAEFEITWQPTTKNPVSLLLLKGPSELAVPIATIVSAIENDGSYKWSVPSTLEPGVGPTGYGIQLIDDITGKYQYSTQFGISNDGLVVSSSAAPSSTPVSSGGSGGYGDGYPTETPKSTTPTPTPTPSSTEIEYPTSSPNSTSEYPVSTIVITSSAVVPSGTGYPITNTTVLSGTKPITVPSSLKTTATPTVSGPSSTPTTTPPPESTGAASHLRAGMGVVAGVAAVFFML